MGPTRILRIEGLAAFTAALATFLAFDGQLRLLAVLALAPDVAMLGYPAGPRVGSLTYNAAHRYVLPVALAPVGLWIGATPALLVAAVWVAHIGADRALGYGLEDESNFRTTHLSKGPTGPGDPDAETGDTVEAA
jgi:hypothetical protein